MFDDYQLTLQDYLSILRRRALAMILVFGAVLTAAVVFAFVSPKVYESSATILVEGPQVQVAATEGVPPPRPEERVNLIRQRLMTRENLAKVADEHQLFYSEGKRVLSETNTVNALRNSIRLELSSSGDSPWAPRSSAISFKLSFQYGDPDKVLAVTKELVDFFLSSNRKDRVEQATRTTEFLTGEAARVRKELETLEAKIAGFKSQQTGSLPDNAAVAQANIQNMEADLRVVERDYRLALSEVRSLEVDLAAARKGVTAPGAVSTVGPSQTEQELERARAQLASLRATYSESHPDVRALVRRIQGLEQAVQTDARVQTPTRVAAQEQAALVASRLQAQLEAARSRVDLLGSQQSSLRMDIGQMRSQAARAPQLERQLAGLERDYEAAKTKYEELRTQLLSAQVVENLEGGQQVERFSLLEPPLAPEYPIKPSRKKIVGAGLLAAVGAAVAIAWLLEMLHARVWGSNALAAVLNQRPMTSIPYIRNTAEVQSLERWRKRSVYIALMVGLLVLLIVHFWILPLQEALTMVTSQKN